MGTYERWWLETVEGGLELSCTLMWRGQRATKLRGVGGRGWYARREWEKWQRQQVIAARLSSKLPAEVL